MRSSSQLPLPLPSRGGKRAGAGRKPKGPRALVSHKLRPRFKKPSPVHVTLRLHDAVWNLRSGRSYRRIKRCFEKSRSRFGARLIEFSVQGNHLHLILEADGNESLSRAMQGLCIRVAKSLNAMMRRSGAVFSDHYHSRLLRSPTELVNAIRYVLGNAAHHFGGEGADPFSSDGLAPGDRPRVLALAVGWLLRVGRYRRRPQGQIREKEHVRTR